MKNSKEQVCMARDILPRRTSSDVVYSSDNHNDVVRQEAIKKLREEGIQ